MQADDAGKVVRVFLRQSGGIHLRPCRQRLLCLTPKGAELARELTVVQARRIAGALEAMPGAADVVASFLSAMINADERGDVMQFITHPAGRR